MHIAVKTARIIICTEEDTGMIETAYLKDHLCVKHPVNPNILYCFLIFFLTFVEKLELKNSKLGHHSMIIYIVIVE